MQNLYRVVLRNITCRNSYQDSPQTGYKWLLIFLIIIIKWHSYSNKYLLHIQMHQPYLKVPGLKLKSGRCGVDHIFGDFTAPEKGNMQWFIMKQGTFSGNVQSTSSGCMLIDCPEMAGSTAQTWQTWPIPFATGRTFDSYVMLTAPKWAISNVISRPTWSKPNYCDVLD